MTKQIQRIHVEYFVYWSLAISVEIVPWNFSSVGNWSKAERIWSMTYEVICILYVLRAPFRPNGHASAKLFGVIRHAHTQKK